MAEDDRLIAPEFSFVVPVYNVAVYLPRCVDSILAQDHGRFEVVLVDDGSEDGSGAICDGYAARDPRVRVLHQENGGLSAARNAGIRAARGDYVVFVDSDDWVEPHACSGLERACDARPDVVVTFAANESPEIGEAVASLHGKPACSGAEALNRMLEAGCFLVGVWRYACRLGFLRGGGLVFKEGLLQEDLDFTPRMLMLAGCVAFNDRPFYWYERRPGSITNSPENRIPLFRDVRDICRGLSDLALAADGGTSGLMRCTLIRYHLAAFSRLTLREAIREDCGNDIARHRGLFHVGKLCWAKSLVFAVSPVLYKLLAGLKNRASRLAHELVNPIKRCRHKAAL